MKSLEEFLYRKLNLKPKVTDYSKKHFDSITLALHNSEIAVEFVRYRDVLTKAYTFGAFILETKSKSPVFFKICTQKKLDEILKRKELESEYKYLKRVYSNPEVYNLIWSKIDSTYPHANTIYASLAGSLNFINHQALLTNANKLLMDSRNIVLVNNTKDIYKRKEAAINLAKSKALLVGGIKYDINYKNAISDTNTSNIYNKFRGQIQGNWEYLSNTHKEVIGINQLLNKRIGTTKTLEGIEASEINFKEKISSSDFDIIHIATHGLFIQPKEKKERLLESVSYTSSGLVMAGANSCFKKESSLKGLVMVFSPHPKFHPTI